MFAVFEFKIIVSIIVKMVLTIKLSVNEAKLTDFLARKCTTIQQVLILKFAFGPKKLPAFREIGPWELAKANY